MIIGHAITRAHYARTFRRIVEYTYFYCAKNAYSSKDFKLYFTQNNLKQASDWTDLI